MAGDWAGWGNQDNQNQDHRENREHQEHQEQGFGSLDDLLGDSFGQEDQDHQEDNGGNEWASHEEDDQSDQSKESPQSEQAEDEHSDKEQNEDSGVKTLTYEDVKDALISVPSNTSGEKVFNERDLFRVFNTTMVLNACDEEMMNWVDGLFNIRVKNSLRRAVIIVQMDHHEIDRCLKPIDTIFYVHNASKVEPGDDPIMKVLQVITEVDKLDSDQFNDVIMMLRRVAKESGASRSVIKSTRGSSSGELVQDINTCLNEDERIADSLRAIRSLVELIKEVSKQ